MRPRSTRKPRTPRLRPARAESLSWPVSRDRLRSLQALVLDCDGVLTKGELLYDDQGRRLLAFDVRDGFGLASLSRSGFPVAVLSGRPIDIAERRHKEMGVRLFRQVHDKAEGLIELCKELSVDPEHTAFVGDDLPDLAAFRVAGMRIAVHDAAPEVRSRADWITQNRGGAGAVREVCETILKARGQWSQLVATLAGTGHEPG